MTRDGTDVRTGVHPNTPKIYIEGPHWLRDRPDPRNFQGTYSLQRLSSPHLTRDTSARSVTFVTVTVFQTRPREHSTMYVHTGTVPHFKIYFCKWFLSNKRGSNLERFKSVSLLGSETVHRNPLHRRSKVLVGRGEAWRRGWRTTGTPIKGNRTSVNDSCQTGHTSALSWPFLLPKLVT